MDANAWAYLNIRHPVCAWAAYRGVLVPPSPGEGFVSVWTAGKLWAGDYGALRAEVALEKARQRDFPTRVSRLGGAYVFPDIESATRASHWPGEAFSETYLSPLAVPTGVSKNCAIDANWITHAYNAPGAPEGWQYRYWSGEPYPGADPIWEVLLDQHAVVLNTPLRERAYQIVRHHLPDAVAILEIGRLAAAAGSDLGNVACHVYDDGHFLAGEHMLNMVDADNPAFLKRLGELLASGHPKREEALEVGADRGVFVLPDLGRMNFKVPKSELKQANLVIE